MNKTFYGLNFQIALALLGGRKLVGMLRPKQLGMLIHEFNGLYEKNGNSIRLTFYVDWKLSTTREKAFNVFSGVIPSVEEEEILKLKWLLLSTTEYNKNVISSGSEILTKNTSDSEGLFNPNETLPFPMADNMFSAEFN